MSVFRKWYWRMGAAVVAGSAGYTIGWGVLYARMMPGPWRNFFDNLSGYLPGLGGNAQQMFLYYGLPSMLMALSTYVLLTEVHGRSETDTKTETLCRKCGYILRGISEPRCPECGERI